MAHIACHSLTQICGSFAAGHQTISFAGRSRPADTAHAGARQLLLMEEAGQWSRPAVNFMGIINGLIISAVFWIAAILLIIKVYSF